MEREKLEEVNSSLKDRSLEKMKKKFKISKPKGKLGVLIPGIGGAVSTTFIAGIESYKQRSGKLFGSLSQMGTIRIGKRTEKNTPYIKDLISLANVEDLEFFGWDVYPQDCYKATVKAGVLDRTLIDSLKDKLERIKPNKAVFNKKFAENLTGKNIKKEKNYFKLALELVAEIKAFKREKNIDRLVMIWCGSTEIFFKKGKIHESIKSFEDALRKNHKGISPSMVYAYAAIKCGAAYANGAPNLSVDIPALEKLSRKNNVPIAGKDFKTGQTLMKTILAPGIKSRLLGLNGWFSTNILGNRDGEVLDNPKNFKTKEESKLSVLEHIFQPEINQELYGDFYHKVRINYYPPRGDQKEAWDNIDIFGWLGYEMQIKVNFLCRDSILAAPIVLDLIIFMDLAQRARMYGIQEWMSFYFKSPMVGENLYPEHDVFVQSMKLKNTLRFLAGEKNIDHLGLDYYYE